ncbi:MAG: hypothetical protein JTT11_08470 [Candidatus Brockarchaeota archaeon]|nr:hypothetical protein [Candidatus Brockarchaeota archaeon]
MFGKARGQKVVRAHEIFNRARIELYCPPCIFKVATGGERAKGSVPISVLNGVVTAGPGTIPPDCDQEKFLLWTFRHELAHAHHCPYDIKTAYSLERAAYAVSVHWDLAYLATLLFSDFQVDFNYLSRRFQENPYHVEVLSDLSGGIGQIALAVQKRMLGGPVKGRIRRSVKEAAREIEVIMLSNRPWQTKVQMLAVVLERMRIRDPGFFSKKAVAKHIAEHPIPVREDFHPATLKLFDDVFGGISDSKAAEAFFKQWILPRLSEDPGKKFEETLRSASKAERKEREKGGGRAGKGERAESSGLSGEPGKSEPLDGNLGRPGQEPVLSTSMSRRYGKLSSKVVNEALWKRYWYRARAERTILQFLSESPSRRPSWAVATYPDDWLIEEEIEKLDLEMSLEEGPLIPEVTTMKWFEEPSSKGQSAISGFVPSVIVALDASMSMSNIHDEAATSAFIAYLCAKKAGGETSAVSFSTNHVSCGWDDDDESKEMALSLSLREYTIFPAFTVSDLASSAAGNCFIIIITDGGWQNIGEAIPLLERIVDRGHRVIIFELPGGSYPERVAALKKSQRLSIHRVEAPERDLQGLVLSEAMRTYQTYL